MLENVTWIKCVYASVKVQWKLIYARNMSNSSICDCGIVKYLKKYTYKKSNDSVIIWD